MGIVRGMGASGAERCSSGFEEGKVIYLPLGVWGPVDRLLSCGDRKEVPHFVQEGGFWDWEDWFYIFPSPQILGIVGEVTYLRWQVPGEEREGARRFYGEERKHVIGVYVGEEIKGRWKKEGGAMLPTLRGQPIHLLKKKKNSFAFCRRE